MKSLYVLFFLFTTSFSVISQDSLAIYNVAKVEKLILEGTEKRLSKWFSGDAPSYADDFTQELTYLDPVLMGEKVYTKDDLRKVMEGRPTDFEFKGIESPRFQHFDDVIILTYSVTQDFFAGIELHWDGTEAFKNVDGEWKIVHAHWSAYSPDEIILPKKILIIGIGIISLIFGVIGFFIGRRKSTKKTI